VKYETARSFRAAIDARLKHVAAVRDQQALVQIRKQIVFERFLARLLEVTPDRWTLKGGVALQYRLGTSGRFTKDLDLVLPGGTSEALAEIRQAIGHDTGDFFTFALVHSQRLEHGDDEASLRFHLTAELDGRLFEKFIVDVGFNEHAPLPAETISGSDFLEFAGILRVVTPVLAIEVHLAEKLHAYTREYEGGRHSTRVKDLVDIVLIGYAYQLAADRMHIAIHHTFESRASQPLPRGFPVPPANWVQPYGEIAKSVPIDPDINAGHVFAAALFNPLLSGSTAPHDTWRASSMEWLPAPLCPPPSLSPADSAEHPTS
jgi:predicted nucleotidyltransferase component of viral defense system